jgi:deoxyribonuclease V
VKCCLDVHYRPDGAVAACVLFREWPDVAPADELVARFPPTSEPYTPGELYKRELPFLLAVIGRVKDALDGIVVDGYVWLDEEGRPGLGARLWEALSQKTPVVGIAKTRFLGGPAYEVVRGRSLSPLFVTAAGIEPERAAGIVIAMHGPHRLPTLVRRADQLARSRRR